MTAYTSRLRLSHYLHLLLEPWKKKKEKKKDEEEQADLMTELLLYVQLHYSSCLISFQSGGSLLLLLLLLLHFLNTWQLSWSRSDCCRGQEQHFAHSCLPASSSNRGTTVVFSKDVRWTTGVIYLQTDVEERQWRHRCVSETSIPMSQFQEHMEKTEGKVKKELKLWWVQRLNDMEQSHKWLFKQMFHVWCD